MQSQIAVVASTLVIFFVLLFAYTRLLGPIPFRVDSITTTKSTTFDVTGEGRATIKPDSANISVGVSATGSSVKEVQDKVNSIINKVSAAVKDQGVDPKDIQTANYNVNPTYDFTGSSQRITGYSADTNITIKVRNIDNVGKVIDAATTAGATNVASLGFDSSDKTAAENEARKKAVETAKRKAADASKIAGFSLGKVLNYSESFGGSPRPIPLGATDSISSRPETTIEPGTNEITVFITLSYEIR